DDRLLAGWRVVDLAGEPAALTGRILADLGADVVKVEPPEGDPLRTDAARFDAWNAGKRSVVVRDAHDPELDRLLAATHVVIDTPGFPGALDFDPNRAPGAVCVRVTPFGLTGPRSHWRASDLGVMAASGNLFCTGDPDRAPVRCRFPVAYAHVGPEAAFAALSALATGDPQIVDVSMQEVVFVANMAGAAQFPRTGSRGGRRGANIGRTREIWPTTDGFVSFGLRGGKARLASLELLTELVDTPALRAMDWSTYSPNTADDETLRAVEHDVGEYFAHRTMAELYEIACETNLMLAPTNSPREIHASAQLEAREFFGPVGEDESFPRSFMVARSARAPVARVAPTAPAPELGSTSPATAFHDAPSVRLGALTVSPSHRQSGGHGRGAWDGLKILEFGSGAAGPIASRYFAEHGATVLRIESAKRPDFLRVYALGPDNPHGLEGSPLYDGLNVGKRNVLFNLKHPRAVELVRELAVDWADAVAENFAPRAMRGFGLDYDSLVEHRRDLVMVSACLNGQTGPHKDYPGFGGQGSALAGYNWLTGWADREPVGPHGTITDSLAPRFVATALAAGLLYRARTGNGVYLDVSQVEAAIYTLAPWLLTFTRTGEALARIGNDDPAAAVHGVFPCATEGDVDDRWVAIAAWTEAERARLADITGGGDLAAWTRTRTRTEIAERLQAAGIEAVPVADFGDLHDDPQVAHREHFVPLTHPHLGTVLYERNGFRLSDAPSTYTRSGPTLGQDQDWVLGELLGLSDHERATLAAEGAFD
ncbi:MAG TPA: CoA transferase, partial [Acidimicrobiia bacterium]|nr:CoA transferase [Acidimicrobiia bacterium]